MTSGSINWFQAFKGALEDMDFFSRLKGKAVKIRHMPAGAVIGDESCNMPLFLNLKRGRRSD